MSDFFEVIWLALKWAGCHFWLPLLAESSGKWPMLGSHGMHERHRTATGTCCHRLACCSVTSHHCASFTSFVNLRALCSCCSCCSCWLPNPCLAIHNTPLARHSHATPHSAHPAHSQPISPYASPRLKPTAVSLPVSYFESSNFYKLRNNNLIILYSVKYYILFYYII